MITMENQFMDFPRINMHVMQANHDTSMIVDKMHSSSNVCKMTTLRTRRQFAVAGPVTAQASGVQALLWALNCPEASAG